MPGGAIADLELSVKELLATDVLTADELVQAGRLLSILDAAFARHTRTLDLLGAAAFEGYGSSRSWLGATTRMALGSAGRHIRRGRYAFAHDASADAWTAGEITSDHLDAMEYVWRHAEDDAAFAEFEHALLDVARFATPSDVAGIGRTWLERLKAERESAAARADDERRSREEAAQREAAEQRAAEQGGAEQDRAEQDRAEHPGGDDEDPADRFAENGTDANPFDGLLPDASELGFTDLVGGFALPHGCFSSGDLAEIIRALNAQIERGHSEGDTRPRGQRMAQALVEICQLYNSRDINAGRNTPHVVLGTDLSVYTDMKIGPITTTDGLLLSREAMHRLACRAVISIIRNGKQEPLNVARSRRDFTRAQRRALEHRDGHTCAFPGCHIPATGCEAHHVAWWELGGLTDLDNGLLLCWFHHRLVHEGRWAIERRPNGYRFWKPDRSEYRDFVRRPPILVDVPTPTRRR